MNEPLLPSPFLNSTFLLFLSQYSPFQSPTVYDSSFSTFTSSSLYLFLSPFVLHPILTFFFNLSFVTSSPFTLPPIFRYPFPQNLFMVHYSFSSPLLFPHFPSSSTIIFNTFSSSLPFSPAAPFFFLSAFILPSSQNSSFTPQCLPSSALSELLHLFLTTFLSAFPQLYFWSQDFDSILLKLLSLSFRTLHHLPFLCFSSSLTLCPLLPFLILFPQLNPLSPHSFDSLTKSLLPSSVLIS